MRYIIIFFILVSFILSGCSAIKNELGENPKKEDNKIATVDDFELPEIGLGKWTGKNLSVTPRATLMSDAYARENSNITGEEILISKSGVLFRNQIFFLSDVLNCNEPQLMSLFNISLGDAAMICDGEVIVDSLKTTGKPVKVLKLCTKNKENYINIIVRKDNKLMLWVGEFYEYIGFYNLEKVKTGDGSVDT